VVLVEIELKDLVSKSVLQQYKAEFVKRVKTRKVKEKELVYSVLSDEDSKVVHKYYSV
jgi:hypothetical protein